MADRQDPGIGVVRYVSGNLHHEGPLIVLDYMPPYPRPDTQPQKVVVVYPEFDCMLRFDDDPIWDVYGSDYETVERALAAIAKAPPPRKPYVTFSFPLNKPKE